MSTSFTRSLRVLVAAGAIAAFMLMALGVEARAASTVTISGNAYAFIFAGNEDRLEGATIGIAEIPELTTTAGPNGFYALEVPNETTITPFARIDGYYTTHHQTFHTRGQDLHQVNFQMPELSTYNLLANGVDADRKPDGTLSKCGIVSTFFQKEGRSFPDFDDFHDFRPHGVEGSTATATPPAGRQLYFNPSVIPDPTQQSSSRDGGVLWVDVEAGTYNIKGSGTTARHASFVATCEPGRLVNANPPWGLYELAGNEETNPATLPDTEVEASVLSTAVVRLPSSGKRALWVRIKANEEVTAAIELRQGKLVLKKRVTVKAGRSLLGTPFTARFKRGIVKVIIVLTDGDSNTQNYTTTLPLPGPRRG